MTSERDLHVQAVRQRAGNDLGVRRGRDRIEGAGRNQRWHGARDWLRSNRWSRAMRPFGARAALLPDAIASQECRLIALGGIGVNERNVLRARDRQIQSVERAVGAP